VDFLQPKVKGRPGSTPGSVDYRLARRRIIKSVEAGDVDPKDYRDAQSELMRVAESCSVEAKEACPLCDVDELRLVRFVFGPRLPKGGRCVATDRELERLANRSGEYRCYVVEVCIACRWNHLQSTYLLDADQSA
jgi:hypothetical protein